MAKIYPERLPESILTDPKRQAERKVYDALSGMSSKYTVYYSVAWQARDKKFGAKDGEADFVVAHPDYGVLVLEVKGGGIAYDANLDQWYSTDRDGVQHSIKNPVNQARNSKHELLKKFKDLPGWEERWLNIGQGVIFPDIYTGGQIQSTDISSEIIIDANGLDDVETAIVNVFQFYQSNYGNRGTLGYDRLQLLDGLLASSFNIKTPLGVELAYEDERLIELTERQMLILDFLSTRRRAAIKGCAGSGKTMLALEKAKLLADQGFKVLLTCFNYALAEYLAHKVSDDVDVMHFHGLCRTFANEAGFPLKRVQDERDFYDNVLPNALLEATDELGPQYDAIIVDEGQDFKEHWFLPLTALLDDPDEGILYVFFDDNQNIYSSITKIPGVIDEAPFSLQDNCRNTKKIHEMVTHFHHDHHLLRCLGPDGRQPEIHYYHDERDQKRQVQQLLHKLVNEERVSHMDIVLLTPKSQSRSVFKTGDRLGNFILVEKTPTGYNQVQVSSIHTFKGLENRLVILAEVDESACQDLDSVLYVGCSRARTHLVLLVDDQLDEMIKNKIRYGGL